MKRHAVLCALLVCASASVFAEGKPINFPAVSLGGAYFDWMKTVYNRVGQPELVQAALTGYDNDFNIEYLAAESMTVSKDGLTWTIKLRKGLQWSDGQPLTAADFAFALQRAATQGYDFGWYWSGAAGIKNWGAVEKKELPVEQLGVKAVDDLTLEVQTTAAKPYFPGVATVWFAVPRHAVDKWGDEYATKAETMVCSGPFMVKEWIKDNKFVLVKNPYYHAPWAAMADQINMFPTLSEAEQGFPAYLAGELDYTNVNVGQLAVAQKQFPKEVKKNANFQIHYISYDYSSKPFNDINVRKAFFYSVNRDEMCNTVLKNLAIPATTLTTPGFPGYTEAISKQVTFDPKKAAEYLSKAGFPKGKGFPEVTLLWRLEGGGTQFTKPMAEYLQAQWKKILGVNIKVESTDTKTWMADLLANKHKMYIAPYNFDYVDASNFFDLFVTPGSRHNWVNKEYSDLIGKADALFDWKDRAPLYQKAEQIIVDQAAMVYLAHTTQYTCWKSSITGPGVQANKSGFYPLLTLYTWTHITKQ